MGHNGRARGREAGPFADKWHICIWLSVQLSEKRKRLFISAQISPDEEEEEAAKKTNMKCKKLIIKERHRHN